MSYSDDPGLPPNIELTTTHQVHRSAAKHYSRPVEQEKAGWPRWAVPLTAAIAAVSLGVAIAAAALFLSYKSSATAQITQLQQAVSNGQQAAQSNTSGIDRLSGKVSTIGAGMAAIAPFSQVCSTDLTDASGNPAAFYFMCSPTKP